MAKCWQEIDGRDDGIAEQTDLSDKYPDRVKAMKELAERKLAEINTNVIPLGE